HRLLDVVFARCPARVNQTDAAHKAVCNLVASHVDGIVSGQLGVDSLVGLAEFERVVASIGLRKLLLDYIGLYSDAQVVGLTGKVSGSVKIGLFGLERGVAQVAPQYAEQAKLVRVFKGPAHFLDLALGLLGAEIDSRPDRDAPHIERLVDRSKYDLV